MTEEPRVQEEEVVVSDRDLGVVLQQLGEEHDCVNIDTRDDGSNGGKSGISSLMPMSVMMPSSSQGSRETGDLSHGFDSDVKLDSLLGHSGTPVDGDDSILLDKPKEVYIEAFSVGGTSQPSPARYTTLGVSRRVRIANDTTSISESSGGTSVSSIFETLVGLGPQHHSRGLNKNSGLDIFLNSNRPEQSMSKTDQREKRMIHIRAGMLILFLVGVLFLVIQIGTVSQREELRPPRLRDKQLTNYPSNSTALDTKQSLLRGKTVSKLWQKHALDEMLAMAPKGEEGPSHFKDGRYDNVSKANIDEAKMRVDAFLSHDKIDAEKKEEIDIPIEFQYLAETKGTSLGEEGTPLFWEIPLSAGLIREVVTTCLSFVVASEPSDAEEYNSDSGLKVITIDNQKMVNVDVTTPAGIQRAKGLDLVGANMSNIIITPLFFESLKLFDANHHGRAFTMMTHPILRAANVYSHAKMMGHSDIRELTIEEYAESSFVENNWMIRYLCGVIQDDVTLEHLSVAKEVLLKHFIIGLDEYKVDSLRRFEIAFGFEYNTEDKEQLQCRDAIIKSSSDELPNTINEHSRAWDLFEKQNILDLKLFRYAKELYSIQGQVYFKDLEPYY